MQLSIVSNANNIKTKLCEITGGSWDCERLKSIRNVVLKTVEEYMGSIDGPYRCLEGLARAMRPLSQSQRWGDFIRVANTYTTLYDGVLAPIVHAPYILRGDFIQDWKTNKPSFFVQMSYLPCDITSFVGFLDEFKLVKYSTLSQAIGNVRIYGEQPLKFISTIPIIQIIYASIGFGYAVDMGFTIRGVACRNRLAKEEANRFYQERVSKISPEATNSVRDAKMIKIRDATLNKEAQLKSQYIREGSVKIVKLSLNLAFTGLCMTAIATSFATGGAPLIALVALGTLTSAVAMTYEVLKTSTVREYLNSRVKVIHAPLSA